MSDHRGTFFVFLRMQTKKPFIVIERVHEKKHPALMGRMLFLVPKKIIFVTPCASYEKSNFYIFPIIAPVLQSCILCTKLNFLMKEPWKHL